MKPGDSKKIYLGISNYLSGPVEFCIAGENFKHENVWCGADYCDGVQEPMTCTSYDELDCGSISISGPKIKTVLRGKIDVIPLTVKIASNAVSDTYLIPIHVCGTYEESTIEEVIDLYVNVG